MKRYQREILTAIFTRLNSGKRPEDSAYIGRYTSTFCGIDVGHPSGIKSWDIEAEATHANVELNARFSAEKIARFLESHPKATVDVEPSVDTIVDRYFPAIDAEASIQAVTNVSPLPEAFREDMAPEAEPVTTLTRGQMAKCYTGAITCPSPLFYFSIVGFQEVAMKAHASKGLATTLGIVIGGPAGMVAIGSQVPFIFNGLQQQELRSERPLQIERLSDVERRRLSQFWTALRIVFSIESAIGAAIYMDKLVTTIANLIFRKDPTVSLSSLFLMIEKNGVLTNLGPLTQFIGLDAIKLALMFTSLCFATVNNDDHVRHLHSIPRYFFPSPLDSHNLWLTQFNREQKAAFHAFLGANPINSDETLAAAYAEVRRVKEESHGTITDRSIKQRLLLLLAALGMGYAAKAQYWTVGLQQIEWLVKIVLDPKNSIIADKKQPDSWYDYLFGGLLVAGNAVVMMRSLMTIVHMLANNRDIEVMAQIKRRLTAAVGLAIIPIVVNILQTLVLNPMPEWDNPGAIADFVAELLSNAASAAAFGIYGAITTGVIVDRLIGWWDKIYEKCCSSRNPEGTYLLLAGNEERPAAGDIGDYKKFLRLSEALAGEFSAAKTTPLLGL